MFGDTDIPTASQSGIVNETLGRSGIHDAVGVINFAVFNRFLFPGGMEGYFFALFSIAISAAETAIAIAIMINIYRNRRSIQVRNLDELKW